MIDVGMYDSSLSDQQTIARQKKVIRALMDRIERSDDLGSSHFALFQSALVLQQEVLTKSERLEEALSALGSTSDKLETAYLDQERTSKNLSDALEVMEEGFALFSEGQLVICNDHFRSLLPDVSDAIVHGLHFDKYIDLVSCSSHLDLEGKQRRENWRLMRWRMHQKPYSSFVISLIDDRWFQISDRRTSFGNTAILQTDITDLVRQNRLEKDRLIDEHLRYMQSAFDHLVLGIASFSERLELQVYNAMFADLLMLPIAFLKSGVPLTRLLRFLQRPNVIQSWDNDHGLIDDIRQLSIGDNIQLKLTRADGTILDVQIHALPSGGYIANVRDITAQAQAQSAMQQLNEMLEEGVRERTGELSQANNKLREQYNDLARAEDELRKAKEFAETANASKTLFLAAASHDLLQPINAAKLFISMLKDTRGRKMRHDYIEKLDRALNSVITLLHDLLDISRLDSESARLAISEFSLNDIFENLDESLRSLAEQKSLQLHFVSTSYFVRSDKHYLQRIVQNLIVNAIQNTEQGKILVGSRNRGSKVLIEVWDTGVGIAQEDLERIFYEFTRVGNPKSSIGMGLGLSIVQRACRRLEHSLEVQSWPDKGSLFRVELLKATPRLREKRVAEVLDSWQSSTDPSLDFLIFLIENDPEVLFATTEMLQHWGADVIAVKSIQEALEQYKALDEQPNLIIADYQLDGQDNGIQAITALRGAVKVHLPAIMITANYSDELQRYGEELDFNILNKPVNLTLMKDLVMRKTNPHNTKESTWTHRQA